MGRESLMRMGVHPIIDYILAQALESSKGQVYTARCPLYPALEYSTVLP